MKKTLIILLLLITSNLFCVDKYLGLTPKEIIQEIGSPKYVLAERGNRSQEDDVVFFYENRIYVYFNQSRVWQLRVDDKYSSDILGLHMGDTKEKIVEVLGSPIEELEDSFLYIRPDRGYPVTLRVYFLENKLDDIYIYRGDY